MTKNDLLVLDANYKTWCESRAIGIDNAFVYYCSEQFLKPYDPTDEDILYGITDGNNDGGVDAVYFIVDRNEFIRDDTEIGNRKPSIAHLVILQVKETGAGFKMTEIDKLHFFSDDLLDLAKSTDEPELVSKYHMHLREIMQTFKDKYLSFATSQLDLSIDYYYITKRDELLPDIKANDSSTRVLQTARKHMSKASAKFQFINAQKLLEQVNVRVSKDTDLRWAYQPMTTKDGTVGIVKLTDFYEFLTEPDGSLAERLFEANVRGFQQYTTVNKQIRDSLSSPDGINFWLLNNGITVIAESIQSAGYLQVTCEDPQIVNGLQSSRAIFEHFSGGMGVPNTDERSILVRLIETNDEKVRDRVIRATNSQNKMEAASLRSTDPVHHEIEEIMETFGLFYDRRKGHYKDKGQPAKNIVSVMEVTKAIIAIIIQRPDDARARAGNYLRKEGQYAQVFGKWKKDGWVDAMPLGAYVTCVQIVRMAQDFLKAEAVKNDEFRGHEHNFRFYMAMYAACSVLESARPNTEELAILKTDLITKEILQDCCKRVWKWYEKLGATDTVAKGSELNKKLLTQIRRRYR